MKRITLLLLSMVVIASTAFGQAGTKLKTVNLNWHTTLSPGAGFTYSMGDSFTVFRGTGIRNSAQQADTTQSIDLRQFIMPSSPTATGAAQDTVGWLRISVFPVGTSPTVTADSLIFAMQTSDDDVTWNATTYSGPLPSTGTTPTSAISLETGGSSNCFLFVVRQETGLATGGIFNPVAYTTVNIKRAYGFKYARLIITGDHTGNYDAEATGFVPAINTGEYH